MRETSTPRAGAPQAGDRGTVGAVLETALLIRRSEECLLELFRTGEATGTAHTCLGQELVAAAVTRCLRPDDTVFSHHRGHGHYLGLTGDVSGLFAEVLGRRAGPCRGLGGSQHLRRGGYVSGGVLGGLVPVAAGTAMAHAAAGSDRIAVAFVGDGTFGEGVVYETLNLASLWRLPLLVVVEDNNVAQSTPADRARAGRLDRRAEAFGVPVVCADSWDADRLVATAAEAVARARAGAGPLVMLVETDRLGPHSRGDDLRDPEHLRLLRARDVLGTVLDAADPELLQMDRGARAIVAAALDAARTSTPLAPADVLPRPTPPSAPAPEVPVPPDGRRVATALREGLDRLLAQDPSVVLIGEDVEDPYGGAFRVTAGLSTAHPGRVRGTPISEAALVGAGTGLALAGHRAIVEIMFGDFVLLAADQLVNQAAKLLPGNGPGQLVVRTPMGGHRGYGPTHSQTLDRHLLGVPGLRVVALSSMVDPGDVYRALLTDGGDPAVVVENKQLYGTRLGGELPAGFRALRSAGPLPLVRVVPDGEPEVSLVGYGGMVDVLIAAADELFARHEVLAQVVGVTLVHPFDIRELLPLLGSRPVVVAEEGQGFAGFGAEVLAQLGERAPGRGPRVARVHAAPVPIPAAAQLEDAVLPSARSVVAAALEVSGAR